LRPREKVGRIVLRLIVRELFLRINVVGAIAVVNFGIWHSGFMMFGWG
jgi:hypothetical protein